MKRGVLLLLSMLIVSLSVSAVEPTVLLSPQDFYETNSVSFELNISNFRGNYEIKSVQADISPLEPTTLVDYRGWSESHNDSIALWSDGSIANNVFLSIFEFLAEAPVVSEDTESDTVITLIDGDDEEHEFTFPITVRNDDTPPELSDFIPEDEGFILEGVSDQPVQVRAIDNETGIENATFHYVRCNFSENITPIDHTHQLVLDEDNLYTNSVDFSEYENEQVVCFDFEAYNKGGDSSTYEGALTVDGVPPDVFLVAPLDGALVSLSDEFSFYASDNLAPVMDCEMVIDGEVSLENISAAHMDTIQIPSADVEEGQHSWSMRCSDQVGLETESETRTYTLDKTPPNITMTAPENGSIVADSDPLEFLVSDNYQLSQVWYVVGENTTYIDEESFSIDISEWPDGPNEVSVIAEDFVGNHAEKTFIVTIDRQAPEIELLSPEENSTSDVHVNFTFLAADDYDQSLDCDLYLDGSGVESVEAISGEEAMFQRILSVGDYNWKVQCVDDAGNEAETSDRLLSVIDLTGPDISMNNPDVVFRGNPILVDFEVTDISGIGAVTAQMRDPDDNVQTISLDNVADTYTASVPTTVNSSLGTYSLEVQAVDTLNNSNSLDDGILVTYNYVIELVLEPGTVEPSDSVTASGLVIYDNGTEVPEEEAVLTIPLSAGNSSDLVLNLSNGTFEHVFTAPSEDGSYDVSLLVASADNGQDYTETASFDVETPQPSNPGGHGGSSGGSGGGYDYGPDDDTSGDNCNTEWRCTAWSPCSDGNQERTCVDVNRCSNDDSKRVETQSCTVPVEDAEVEDEEDDTPGDTVVKTRRQVQEPEVVEVDETDEDSGDSAGIGKAAGFLNLGNIGLVKMLLVMVMMTVLLGTLKRYGGAVTKRKKRSAPQDVLSGKDKLGLEDYLESRRHRFGR